MPYKIASVRRVGNANGRLEYDQTKISTLTF